MNESHLQVAVMFTAAGDSHVSIACHMISQADCNAVSELFLPLMVSDTLSFTGNASVDWFQTFQTLQTLVKTHMCNQGDRG